MYKLYERKSQNVLLFYEQKKKQTNCNGPSKKIMKLYMMGKNKVTTLIQNTHHNGIRENPQLLDDINEGGLADI